jgi:hypothetical protein
LRERVFARLRRRVILCPLLLVLVGGALGSAPAVCSARSRCAPILTAKPPEAALGVVFVAVDVSLERR